MKGHRYRSICSVYNIKLMAKRVVGHRSIKTPESAHGPRCLDEFQGRHYKHTANTFGNNVVNAKLFVYSWTMSSHNTETIILTLYDC